MSLKSQQNFPQASLPLVDPATGVLSFEWYTFFRSLWVKTGSGTSSTGTLAYVQQEGTGGAVFGVYNALTGARLGSLQVTQP